MKFIQYYLDCLSHASYLIGDETTGHAAEFETVHTPGAYNVPQDLLRGRRDDIVATSDDDRTQRWDLKSQVRLLAGSLVLCGALRSVAAPTLRWTAARKAR